jgi:hypothetical protein
MRISTAAAALGLAVIAAACSQVTASTGGLEIPVVRLRSQPWSFEFNSGWDAPTRTVIRDQATWEAAWAKTYSRMTPVPPVPAVDFGEEMVILVASGEQLSGGYGIVIEHAAERGGNGIAVTVRTTSPGSQCVVTGALTQPVDIARVARRDGSVRFIEREEVRDCS